MQRQPNANGIAKYQFVFAGLPENVEYYVAAGALASPHYTVRVVDLPAVKADPRHLSLPEVDGHGAGHGRTLRRSTSD